MVVGGVPGFPRVGNVGCRTGRECSLWSVEVVNSHSGFVFAKAVLRFVGNG